MEGTGEGEEDNKEFEENSCQFDYVDVVSDLKKAAKRISIPYQSCYMRRLK